jgi:hypothetical protein
MHVGHLGRAVVWRQSIIRTAHHKAFLPLEPLWGEHQALGVLTVSGSKQHTWPGFMRHSMQHTWSGLFLPTPPPPS